MPIGATLPHAVRAAGVAEYSTVKGFSCRRYSARSYNWGMNKRAVRRAGFTLVELLVVVAIVALLIAILLPSLEHAREAANSARCLGNQRQLVIANLNYAQAAWDGLLRVDPF